VTLKKKFIEIATNIKRYKKFTFSIFLITFFKVTISHKTKLIPKIPIPEKISEKIFIS